MYSCSEVPDNITEPNLALESRSQESCEPDGEFCDDGEVLERSFGTIPCGVTVRMKVTRCSGEFHYEEVDVVPSDPTCTLTMEQLEAAYRIFIRLDLNDNISDIPRCAASTTFVSNYIKQSCVQQCEGPGPVGGPFPIIFVPCFSGATGCCIEIDRYCVNLAGGLERIGEDFEVIQGNCSSSQTQPCTEAHLGICIPDRCR